MGWVKCHILLTNVVWGSYVEDWVLYSCAGRLRGTSNSINLSPSPGFRRGEDGWVDEGWAFMVARGWGMQPIHRRANIFDHWQDDHKGRYYADAAARQARP
jgi:hypothetical protein